MKVKSTYKVVLTVSDRNALADIVDAVEGRAASIEISAINKEAVLTAQTVHTPRAPRAVRKPRAFKRKSKVNEAIFNAVSNRSASIAELKVALENAGMSASSLSTGIAALTKAGQIERVGDGLYAIKVAKAAE